MSSPVAAARRRRALTPASLRRSGWVTVGIVTLLAGLTACAPSSADPAVALPPVGGGLDYQLGGAYDPPAGVDIVVRDSTAAPADGLYSVCYVNGFQTQPAESAAWLADTPELVLTTDGSPTGTPVRDENWPDELLLDTSTAAKRAAIADRMLTVIEGCAAAGYAALEIDNLDSFTRSDDRLTVEDNLALARLLADGGRESGLAVGQKNAAELADRLTGIFDFAVAEECDRWNECGLYTAAYGDRVLAVEYSDDLRVDFAAACAAPGHPLSMILRDRDLVTPTEPNYVYQRC